MINETGFELTPPAPVAPAAPSLTGVVLHARPEVARAKLDWGRRSAWAGRACLLAFAAVALVSANRNAGLLTIGAFGGVSSALRGTVRVGVAYGLVPIGAVLWLTGRWILFNGWNGLNGWNISVVSWFSGRLSGPRPGLSAMGRLVAGWFGPVVVSGPIAFLIVLSIARLSPTIGWGDVAFVVVGLALLALAYLFVLKEQLPGRALAAFVAGVSGLQAGVGLGQFIRQGDLGLSWLGELALNPSVTGISVVGGDPTRILRAYGLMRHPNALGAILPLGLLASISLWSRGQTAWRYFWLGVAALIAAGLVVSFSRAGWLGASAGMAVLVVAGLPAQKSRPASPGQRRALLALLVTGLVVAILVGLRPDLFRARLTGGLNGASILERWSVADRTRELRRALDLIQRWPVWGVGTRRYVIAEALVSGDPALESLLVNSTPLVLWAENGVAAPVAWLGLGLIVVVLGCRKPPATMPDPDLALATGWFAAVQVVCLFQAFFWPTQELWQGSIWLGIVLGLWARAWTHSSPLEMRKLANFVSGGSDGPMGH